jgi:hypothetical protein
MQTGYIQSGHMQTGYMPTGYMQTGYIQIGYMQTYVFRLKYEVLSKNSGESNCYVTLKNSVSTTQIKPLMLFRDILAVHCDSHTYTVQHMNRGRQQNVVPTLVSVRQTFEAFPSKL